MRSNILAVLIRMREALNPFKVTPAMLIHKMKGLAGKK